MEIWPGTAYPLGATYDGAGTNFALFSEVADRVELCLFDSSTGGRRLPRPGSTCPRPTASSGTATCPRSARASATASGCTGRTTRPAGQRCNPSKLLLDPYAKAVEGQVDWDESLFGYRFADAEPSATRSTPAAHTMKSVVINPFFDWQNDRHPGTPYHETVIYEAHVKGLTMTHPALPEEIRGTYAGIGAPGDHRAPAPARRHRDRADAGAPVRPGPPPRRPGPVELLGLQHDRLLRPAQRLLRPAASAASRCSSSRRWSATLHAAGIEVILDVVYNHTAEGNHLGPTLSFRGIDNAAYYRLVDDDPEHYYDTTGTGNTLLMRHPHVLQLIMDSLRYWVTEMHVDGFRFDLAVDAGPPVPRGRPAVGVLRPGPAGPGDLARSS